MLAICSLAFGHEYLWRLDRLQESIKKFHPEAELFFYRKDAAVGKPFRESMYGFKPHVIQQALTAGHTKVVYLDATVVLLAKLDYYDSKTAEHKGVLAVQDDNKLHRFVSDRALNYFQVHREDAKDMHLVGGSFYYFDFQFAAAQSIFNTWQTAEKLGIFGSQAEEAAGKLQGHRHDESVMALSLYKHGSKPFTGDTKYNYSGPGAIIKKMHFK